MKAIAEDLGINYWVLVQWKKEYEEFGEAAFIGKKPISSEQEELRKLKKELETVKMERDTLKKVIEHSMDQRNT
ncbi:MAG: transposase [Candidatus Riflebacteria bacterium]|nr:transposase [Candidatus Riflebacteria bacterium]